MNTVTEFFDTAVDQQAEVHHIADHRSKQGNVRQRQSLLWHVIKPVTQSASPTWRKLMAAKAKSSGRPTKESPDGNELFILELQEIYSAENQLSKILPRLAKAAESDTLQKLLDERIAEGERVLKDVEAGLAELDATPGRNKNVAAEGLVNDVREHVQEIEAGPALDAALIGSLQKTEHYCIAAWGTAKALGNALGQLDVSRAMDRAIRAGSHYDERLTSLSEREVIPALLQMNSGASERRTST